MSSKTTLAGAAAVALAVGVAAAGNDAEAQERLSWKLASTYPGSLPQLGTLGVRIEERLAAISDGEIRLRFYEPGALVPAFEVFDAVAEGAIEAAWSTPGYWADKIPAAPLFSAVPFGPTAPEYIAWFYFGGGQELYEEIFEEFNIHPMICGVISPEASGWSKEPVESIEDLRGLRLRFFGLGAKVLEKMGASTRLVAGGDVHPALERGSIDAGEFSTPAVDHHLGFHQVAEHYYLPGWHQPSTMLELLINAEAWEALDEQTKVMFETVCGDNVRHGIAESEAIQIEALDDIADAGVTIHEWPDDILARLEAAWREVVEEEKAADENFARVWASLSSFRRNYARWRELGYLD
jgi:TRAP-type mannitol/chloroaromatic compound transport system substrate-binding protein